MPSTCVFHLSNPDGVYNSGDEITGSIVLHTTSDKNIRNIRLRLLGEANVHWTDTESQKKPSGSYEQITLDYRAQEVYVNYTVIVRRGDFLPAGTYEFPIRFHLPETCASSCWGEHGNVHYSLKLTVDRPLRIDNEFSQSLIITKRLDLNLRPEFKIPLLAEEVSSVGCWPCSGGNVTCSLHLPFGAYASGQTLQYTLNIQNQSMTDISGYKIKFVERMTFYSHTPHYSQRVISTTKAKEVYSDTCLRLSNRQYDGEIELTSLRTSTQGHRIIQIDHFLSIELFVEGCHRNKSISVPVVIGTVPINESMPQRTYYEESDRELPAPSAPTLYSILDEKNSADKPPSYTDLKPPSFDEAVLSSAPLLEPDDSAYSNSKEFEALHSKHRQRQGKQ